MSGEIRRELDHPSSSWSKLWFGVFLYWSYIHWASHVSSLSRTFLSPIRGRSNPCFTFPKRLYENILRLWMFRFCVNCKVHCACKVRASQILLSVQAEWHVFLITVVVSRSVSVYRVPHNWMGWHLRLKYHVLSSNIGCIGTSRVAHVEFILFHFTFLWMGVSGVALDYCCVNFAHTGLRWEIRLFKHRVYIEGLFLPSASISCNCSSCLETFQTWLSFIPLSLCLDKTPAPNALPIPGQGLDLSSSEG